MKRLENYMTSGFQAEMDPIFVLNLIRLVNSLFGDYPYDMMVFEPNDVGLLQIRLAGYNFDTNQLDETTIVAKTELKIDRPFWFKIDDYGDRYVGTFLFPEEY